MWLRFATVLGTFQMIVLLSIVYFTMVMMVAIPFKLRADPLRLKRNVAPGWVVKAPVSDIMAAMRRQG
jgi:hypothetical protein